MDEVVLREHAGIEAYRAPDLQTNGRKALRISINVRPLDGPWGGGNRFLHALREHLEASGHSPCHSLEPTTDVVLIVDPRIRNPQLTFTAGSVLAHLRRYPETVVVHRINECDQRKGTRGMNMRLRLANYCADHTVFIASWLEDLEVWRRETTSSVILNGTDESIFRRDSARVWRGHGPVRIVTHHWGPHPNKGWDVYRRIDEMLGRDTWREKIAFTFVGNLPPNIALKNIEVRPPLDGSALAAALAEHHVYLTASVNEPGGMHHIEGALIGLPLIFRSSGALPEYCTGFGELFDGPEDVATAIERMLATYPKWKSVMSQYANTGSRMAAEYVALFEHLYVQRQSVASRRKLWRDPIANLLARAPI